MKFQTILNRINSDYFMPSRIDEYYLLLEEILNHGYTICSIEDFWHRIKGRLIKTEEKYLILRHDIDTDVTTAKLLWEIEKSFGVQSSYYFRLTTFDDIDFIRMIAASGSEASYHYEELATVVKKKCLKTKRQVLQEMPCIRGLFEKNINLLRKRSGLPLNIVASHGDFINRKLGILNLSILEDRAFRKNVEIELEAYDQEFMKYIISHFSDTIYPLFWKPYNPLDAVRRGDKIIYILIHPRHWKTNKIINTIDNANRILESLRYRFNIREIK